MRVAPGDDQPEHGIGTSPYEELNGHVPNRVDTGQPASRRVGNCSIELEVNGIQRLWSAVAHGYRGS
jgi:hypothetical protein